MRWDGGEKDGEEDREKGKAISPPLLIRPPIQLNEGPTLLSPFNLNHLRKPYPPDCHIEVRAPTYESGCETHSVCSSWGGKQMPWKAPPLHRMPNPSRAQY